MRKYLVLILVFIITDSASISGEYLGKEAEPNHVFYDLPGAVAERIKQEMSHGFSGCDNKIILYSDQFFDMDGKGLLVLLGISDYLCNSNSFIPVKIDTTGKWEFGNFIQGKPSFMIKGPDKGFWLNAQWQIEGTYPSLYRSLDGIDWKKVGLPKNRNVDCCFEWIDRLCFYDDTVFLEFHGDSSGIRQYWECSLLDVFRQRPVWYQRPELPGIITDSQCNPGQSKPHEWERDDSTSSTEVLFKKFDKSLRMVTIVIPKWIAD
jgi:hypothetical protein